MRLRQTTSARRLTLLLVSSWLLASPSVARAESGGAGSLIAKARDAEAALINDEKRLRLRHNLEALVQRWQRALAAAGSEQKQEALEGHARALALLARWSGLAADKERAADAKAKLPKGRPAKESKPTVQIDRPREDPPRATSQATLKTLDLEVSEAGVELTLPGGQPFKVKSERIPPKEGLAARIYFDLSPLVAARSALSTIPIDHPAVARLRVGQFDADTVRFVFDVPRGKQLPEVAELTRDDPPRLRLFSRSPGPKSPAIAQGPAKSEAAKPDPEEVLKDLRRAIGEAVGEHDGAGHDAMTPESKAALDAIVGELKGGDGQPDPLEPGVERNTAPSSESSASENAREDRLSDSTRDALARRRDFLVRVRRVVIDPGHGGRDTGAIGKAGTKEKDVNLGIARALGKALKERLGVEVVYTRDKDTYVSLARRVQIAHASEADLLISVHSNAHRNRKLAGIETYYLNTTSSRYANRLAQRENAQNFDDSQLDGPEPEENSEGDAGAGLPQGALGRDLRLLLADLAMRSATQDSRHLAGLVQSNVVKSLRRQHPEVRDLGVKHALFFVLLGARMPSVLIESGFVSNADEERHLSDPVYQRRIAQAIARAVERFAEERSQVAAHM